MKLLAGVATKETLRSKNPNDLLSSTGMLNRGSSPKKRQFNQKSDQSPTAFHYPASTVIPVSTKSVWLQEMAIAGVATSAELWKVETPRLRYWLPLLPWGSITGRASTVPSQVPRWTNMRGTVHYPPGGIHNTDNVAR